MSEPCITGKIAAVDEKEIVVVFEQSKGCKSCGMQQVCHQQTMEFERRRFPQDFQVGQQVELIYEKVIQTALILYMIPLLFFFGGIALSKLFFPDLTELVLFLGGMVGVGLALFIVRWLNTMLGEKKYRVSIRLVGDSNLSEEK